MGGIDEQKLRSAYLFCHSDVIKLKEVRECCNLAMLLLCCHVAIGFGHSMTDLSKWDRGRKDKHFNVALVMLGAKTSSITINYSTYCRYAYIHST